MYENIRLEKGLYSITGKTFTQALASLDPDSQYENTPLKNLDAFERQLKRFDIKTKGKDCDKVEKFFLSTESAVLFPEYVRRMIKKGMDEASITQEIVAAVSYTDTVDFRGITITDTSTSLATGEGASVPTATVKLSSAATRLTKFAKKFSCSYESIRKQRLETLGVILRSLGGAISKEVNKLCLTEISRNAKTTSIEGDTLMYSDLTEFWAQMKDFDMTTMVCDPKTMAAIMAMDEMKLVVSDYMSNGIARTPYGVTIVKCSQLPENTAVGIDKNNAVEMIFGTDVIVDFDKLITNQYDDVACSVMVGFSVINQEAVKKLSTSASV